MSVCVCLVRMRINARTVAAALQLATMEATLVAKFLHSLPNVFAESGTPRDVDRVLASLRTVIAMRSLERRHRMHLLQAVRLLCKLQCGLLSIAELEKAIVATDLVVCEHDKVSCACSSEKCCTWRGWGRSLQCERLPVGVTVYTVLQAQTLGGLYQVLEEVVNYSMKHQVGWILGRRDNEYWLKIISDFRCT